MTVEAPEFKRATRRIGFDQDELPAVFELLERVARAAVATIGPDCEAVVHDLRTPDHSVVAIAGTLTGRQVGAPVPDPQLLPGEVDRFLEDDLRRNARTSTGRELLASTVWVRDEQGHIVGALCLNLDRSGLEGARDLIDRHLGAAAASAPLPTFAADVSEFTRSAVAALLGPAPGVRRLRRAERIELIRHLHHEGVFALRGAAAAVAAEIGVSRASVYADLREAQDGRLPPRPTQDAGPSTRTSRFVRAGPFKSG